MPDLATVEDLEAALGRDLTAAEAARAPALLAQASAKLRTFTKMDFAAAEDDEIVLRPVGAMLRLPNRPTAVSEVAQMGADGSVGRVLPAAEWAWAGLDEIELWPNSLPPLCSELPDRYRVTYDHDGTVPDFIKVKAVELVLRTLMAPTMAPNLVSERAGNYHYQYGQFPGGQSPGPTVVMTEADERELRLAGYRRGAMSIQTRYG